MFTLGSLERPIVQYRDTYKTAKILFILSIGKSVVDFLLEVLPKAVSVI